LSEKVIKSQDVKLVEKPALTYSRFVRSQTSGDKSSPSPARGKDLTKSSSGEKEQQLAAARQEGYDRGFAEGRALQKRESLPPLNALTELIKEINQWKEKLYSGAEEEMLGLILAIAEKIIHEEVRTNKRVILAVLREAVKHVMDKDGMKVRLNPQDFRFIVDMKADILQELNGGKNILFEEDAGIKPGGTVLETLSGEIDARLENQLTEIKAALKING